MINPCQEGGDAEKTPISCERKERILSKNAVFKENYARFDVFLPLMRLRYIVFSGLTSGIFPKKQKCVKSFSVKTFKTIQKQTLFIGIWCKYHLFVLVCHTYFETNINTFQYKFSMSNTSGIFRRDSAESYFCPFSVLSRKSCDNVTMSFGGNLSENTQVLENLDTPKGASLFLYAHPANFLWICTNKSP